MKIKMFHCQKRALERYGLQFNDFDLIFIQLLCEQGLAKLQPKYANIQGVTADSDTYHLRYAGKLIAPTISAGIIVTFRPTGKRKKDFLTHCKSKQSKSYQQMQKRLNNKQKCFN